MKKNFFLFFVTSKHSRQKSHVDEQSIMPINLFNLFDSFLTDPWSLIRRSLILLFQETRTSNPRILPYPFGYSCFMIDHWLDILGFFLRFSLLLNSVTSAVTAYIM